MNIYSFSTISEKRRDTCDPKIIKIMNAAIKTAPFDFSIVSAYRNEQEQNDCVKRGTSSLIYPRSKHNTQPSRAIDIAPYSDKLRDIDWKDEKKFHILSYHIRIIAYKLGIDIIWGGDWKDKKRDLPHYEVYV